MSNKLQSPLAKSILLLSKVDSKDKLVKTLQYASRFLWWTTQCSQRDIGIQKSTLSLIFSALDGSFGDARRVFKLGGFVKWMKDLLKEPLLAGNMELSHTFAFVNTLSNFLAESVDVILWGIKVKLVTVNKKRWEWIRNLLWMITIVYTIGDQIISWKQIISQRRQLILQKRSLKESNEPNAISREAELQLGKDIVGAHEKLVDLLYSYIRYGSDFVLCAALLADWEHKGLFGLLGVISGVIGLKQAWEKV